MYSGEPQRGVLILKKITVLSVSVPKKTTSSTSLFQWSEISHLYCLCGIKKHVVVHWSKVCVDSGIYLHIDRKTGRFHAWGRKRVSKIHADCFGYPQTRKLLLFIWKITSYKTKVSHPSIYKWRRDEMIILTHREATDLQGDLLQKYGWWIHASMYKWRR